MVQWNKIFRLIFFHESTSYGPGVELFANSVVHFWIYLKQNMNKWILSHRWKGIVGVWNGLAPAASETRMIWHQRCFKHRSAGAATKISLEVNGVSVPLISYQRVSDNADAASALAETMLDLSDTSTHQRFSENLHKNQQSNHTLLKRTVPCKRQPVKLLWTTKPPKLSKEIFHLTWS
jgi:hypothetical protein